jgi:hypothetical protein
MLQLASGKRVSVQVAVRLACQVLPTRPRRHKPLLSGKPQ